MLNKRGAATECGPSFFSCFIVFKYGICFIWMGALSKTLLVTKNLPDLVAGMVILRFAMAVSLTVWSDEWLESLT